MSAPESQKSRKGSNAKVRVPGGRAKGTERAARSRTTAKKKAARRTSKPRAGPGKVPRGNGKASAATKGTQPARSPGSAEPPKPGGVVPPELPAPRGPRTKEDLIARKEEEINLMLRLLHAAETRESRRRITILSRRRHP